MQNLDCAWRNIKLAAENMDDPYNYELVDLTELGNGFEKQVLPAFK